MRLSEEVLMAYADHELDESTRASVEAAMAADPQIARRIAEHQALRKRLRSTFDPVLNEPVPARLLDAVRNAPVSSSAPPSALEESSVTRLPRRAVRGGSLTQWAALAASLMVGFFGGWLAFRSGGPGPLAMRNGQLVARGPLARALTHQLASEQRGAQRVQIGVSFRSKADQYCRTFSMRSPAVAGLACHTAEGWRLQMLGAAEAEGVAAGGYRQAASSMPPAVVVAVSDEISGEPLDARAEAAARASGWKP